MALPTTTSTKIQITNTTKDLTGLFIWVNVLIVVQIYGNIFIWPKKIKEGKINSPPLLLQLRSVVLQVNLNPVLP